MTAPAVLLEWSPARPSQSRRRRARRRFAMLIAGLSVVCAALPLSALVEVGRWGAADERTPTDAIVVLGAAQYQGAPSPVLANRLEHARQLYKEGVANTIITVGGFRSGDVTSEAQAGKAELEAAGVPSKHVIALPFGANTRESLEAVATIAGAQGIDSVTLVSDPAHMARSRALAEAMGLHPQVSPTDDGPGSAMTADYVARESLGLITVWLDQPTPTS